MTDTKNVLFIIGSLREKSFNRQLAKKAEELIGSEADVRWLNYEDVPLMNQDIEFPAPEAVSKVRQQVEAADGIWIFSPEYNHSIPGLLKNLLDWVSRPLAPDYSVPSVMNGKKVTYSSCAGSSGGHYMMTDLNKVLGVLKCECVDTVTTGIKLNREMFTTNELMLSDDDVRVLSAQVRMFMDAL